MSAMGITIFSGMSIGTVQPAVVTQTSATIVRPPVISQGSVVLAASVSQGNQTVTPDPIGGLTED